MIINAKCYFRSLLSKQLISSRVSPNVHWSILKTFLNNQKIPCIPPLFQENKFITDFKEKSEIFKVFFFFKVIHNNGQGKPVSFKSFRENWPTTFKTLATSKEFLKILQNPNKGHGHDMISI